MKRDTIQNKKYKLPILIILLLIILISTFLFFNLKKESTGLVGYAPGSTPASLNPEIITINREIETSSITSSSDYLMYCKEKYKISLGININESLQIPLAMIVDMVPEGWEILTKSSEYVNIDKNKEKISWMFLNITDNPIKDSVVSYEVCKKNQNNGFRGYWQAYLDLNKEPSEDIIYGSQGDSYFKTGECANYYGKYCYNKGLFWHDSCGTRAGRIPICSADYCVGPEFDIKMPFSSACSKNPDCYDSDGFDENKTGYVIAESSFGWFKEYDYCKENSLVELSCVEGTSLYFSENIKCPWKCEEGRCAG